MLNRDVRLVITVSLLAASICGCAKPAYTVPGLQLPPNAVVVRRADTPETSGFSTGPHGKRLMTTEVDFNCPDGWESVVSSFDSKMAGLGFKEKVAGMEKRSGSDMRTYTRMYTKEGSKYIVFLHNNSAFDQATGAPAEAGEFSLSVQVFER